jgi:hypothetical protein
MACMRKRSWAIGLALGLVVGLIFGGLWPSSPLHAVATDHSENFAMATGFVDDNVEAVFLMDFLTGSLKAAVVSNQRPGFQAFYESSVLADLATSIAELNVRIKAENVARKKQGAPARPDVQAPQTPHFLMVTGMADLRRGAARARPSRSVVYVAETNTGVVLAYVLPWESDAHMTDRRVMGKLILWAGDQFAATVTRTE